MTLRIVLLAILAILVLLWFLPLRLLAEYGAGGGKVRAKLGPAVIRIFPRGEKKRKKEKKEKKKKREKEPKKEEKNGDAEKKSGGKVQLFRQLLDLGLEALGTLRKKLRVEHMTLYLAVAGQGKDAASSALLYGRAWAAIGGLIPLLEQTLVIENRDVQVEIDYAAEETKILAAGSIRIRLGQLLTLAVHSGIKALKAFIQYKTGKS